MIGNTSSSFFARMGRKFFNWRLNREIFHRIFPHVQRESNEGYPFGSYAEMNQQSEIFDVQNILEGVERQIEQLPTAYGQCFRLVMRRDIHQRLKMYAEVAKRRTPPETIDPRFVVRHA